MTTFLGPDEANNVDLADSRHRRDQDRVACFLHLRDLVYLHPAAALASAVSFVQALEAKVVAEKPRCSGCRAIFRGCREMARSLRQMSALRRS